MKKNITHDGFLNAEGADIMPQIGGGMSPEKFCYWLQGYLETARPKVIDATGTQIIKDHLKEVFHKVTPDVVGPEEMLICDTGSDSVNIWDKYKDKLPSIFKRTIYRMPTTEELKEVASFNLTPLDLGQGFTYTMVGRGVYNDNNINQIRQSLYMLSKMYPSRAEYAQALHNVTQPMLAC